MEFGWLTTNVGILPLRTTIGVVRRGGGCCIIDTGIDEDAGRRILKAAEALGLSIKAVVNTHSHSDHYGGNEFLVSHTGASVFAPAGEAWVIENPWLEAAYFSMGAVPSRQLLNKFVAGPASKVDVKISAGPFDAAGIGLDAVPLPGHSFAMTGIAAEGVLFCGDALFGEEAISKHRVLFLHDPDKTRESLRRIETLPYDWFVPSHGPPCGRRDIGRLVASNIAAIDGFDGALMASLTERMAMSRLASKALVASGLSLDDETKVTLMQSTAQAHIHCLARKGLLSISPGLKGSEWEGELVCSPT